MNTDQRHEDIRRELATRELHLAMAEALTSTAMVCLQAGQRHHQPRQAYRAGGLLVEATDHYRRAGMARKAAAVARLLERCRRAWIAHEAGEGFN